MSHEDIQKGSRWSPEIATQLTETKAGIVCVTPDNVDAAWLAFEAGALVKTVDRALVCPFLVGLRESDLRGPLAQFQAATATRQDTRRLLGTLNTAMDLQGISEKQLDETFDMWWPRLELELAHVPTVTGSPPTRSVPDMLEELLELARDTNRRQVGSGMREISSRVQLLRELRQMLATTNKVGFGAALRQVIYDLELGTEVADPGRLEIWRSTADVEDDGETK